jgi:hypothetical protein
MANEQLEAAFAKYRDEHLGGVNGQWDGGDRLLFNAGWNARASMIAAEREAAVAETKQRIAAQLMTFYTEAINDEEIVKVVWDYQNELRNAASPQVTEWCERHEPMNEQMCEPKEQI